MDCIICMNCMLGTDIAILKKITSQIVSRPVPF